MNMEMHNNPAGEMQIAITEIRAILQQMYSQMGGNEAEKNIIEGLLYELDKGEISPTEAVTRAREVRDSKNAGEV